ncbi:MAG: citramalate synthase [Chloroflexi bacterium]|nr:citramalate synthase [Chloroflexota bacterium]
MRLVEIYDTTLRDGTQREGISLSVEDKVKIVRKLDQLGIQFIEGGWPGSNPKDAEFFVRARSLPLANAIITSFGSTRKANARADKDQNLRALVDSRTKVATLVGKCWTLHVTEVLKTVLDENLRMIEDSVRFLRSQGIRVIFDAEHFFDGFKADSDYARRAVAVAGEAGAECIALCDTNGGALPAEVGSIVDAVRAVGDWPLGIHTHNDCELAVANSLAAVEHGAIQVQGTINGYGERCGNANLCSIIPSLKLKMGVDCVPDEQLSSLTEVSRYISEISNLTPDSHQPYVGASAFAHKAGLHVDAMMKSSLSYQHIDPLLVGNRSRVLLSELSGKGSIIYKARERGLDVANLSEQSRGILDTIKALESRGFQFDGAEASFELLVRRSQPGYRRPFDLVDFLVLVEKRRRPSTTGNGDGLLSEATVKVRVNGDVMHTAAEGNGPVNALDLALRKSLLEFYPSLSAVRLVDYKVRALDETEGTGAQVRVVIESSDGEHQWRTVGSSENIIEASWIALADSLEYWLLKRAEEGALE